MKSRKTERKNARKEKKKRRNMYFINKNKSKISDNLVEKVEEMCDKSDERFDEKDSNYKRNKIENKIELKNKNRIERKEKRKTKKLSLKQKRDIEIEEKEMKRLEKKLKLNRRNKSGKKSTTLPKSFQMEGLDYILDVIDSTKDQKAFEELENEDQMLDQNNGSQESDIDSNVCDFDEEDMDVNDSDNSGEESETDLEPKHRKANPVITDPKNELKEDIYGFIRDGSGNIVKDNEIKHTISANVSHINQQLLRQIRGALNRLTVNNILQISSQIKDLFRDNSRHEVNESLFACINTSLIDLDYTSPPKLTTQVSILITVLYSVVGEEVGGHAIHSLVKQFNELIAESDSKRIDNLVLLIINLYVCGLIDSSLIYEIIAKLCDNFCEKSIELINLILKSVGFVLRKDNAIKMKELILRIQNEAKSVDKNSLSGTRITFLLDSLIAIKNNNMSKFKDYGTVVDIDLIETTLKSTIKKMRVDGIAGSYDAILQSSHWYSYTQNIEAINSDKQQINESVFDNKVDHQMTGRLFKALRLNTPLRKTIVMALSTCNDYIDASHRLIAIGKKQFSEVINVLLHVAIHEKHFNPFYSHLFQQLTKCDRKYRIALDFSIRDKITELESLESNEQLVLAQLVFELLKSNALTITCLKVVQFSDMNPTYVEFIKRILTGVLSDEQHIQPILSKIPNKDSFATAIRLFINCFIDPKHRHKLNVKTIVNSTKL